MGKPNSEFSLLLTLEGASLPLDTIAAIYGLDEARDPVTTPAHKPFIVVSAAGPSYRVRADELRRVFGSRRRPGAPLPIGHARPRDVK